MQATCTTPLTILDLMILINQQGLSLTKLLNVQYYLPSCHSLCLGAKYLPQHSIHRHSQSMFIT
jgi:hypothetical protein